MKKILSLRRAMFSMLLGFSLVAPLASQAQSDNFDSGTLDPAWLKSEFSPALTSYTFPTSGSGKALRLQANPFPGTAPAVAAIYRTNSYTDFYVAVDLIDWGGAAKNQAVVLIARYGGLSPANPATGSGMICNYDCNQYGENPTDRRSAQLQINTVAPGFSTSTKALAEVTFVPGRSYRIIFKGVGTHYTVQAYDISDLTTPLVTLQADDATYTNGVCGMLGFSRQGLTGTVDVTLDNYYAGASDPNLAAAPALQHSIAGTPIVETRVPSARFKNFHNPATGLSFVAKTYAADLIDTSATKLRLNGMDVSSQLSLPANGTNASISLPGSALKSNTVYSAQLELADTTGTKKSTNLFWFDTFSDAYLLSGAVKTIEAEEYNYTNGVFQADPIPVSGFTVPGAVKVNGDGIGYLDLIGTTGPSSAESVDYYDHRTSGESPWAGEFRLGDNVGLSQGMYPEIADSTDPSGATRFSDNVRSQYAASNLLEFVVHRTEPGEWLNYTRVFTPGKYFAYLRVASFGLTTVNLDKVTSDPTMTNQTTVGLGTFSIPNNITRYNYRYIPALDGGGQNAILDLSGTNTLRLTMDGTIGQDNRKLAINYILLVPAVQLFSSSSVAGSYVADATATVNATTRTITVLASGNAMFYRLSAGEALTITGISVSGGTVTIKY